MVATCFSKEISRLGYQVHAPLSHTVMIDAPSEKSKKIFQVTIVQIASLSRIILQRSFHG